MYSVSLMDPDDLVSTTSLAYEVLPERYSPTLFINLYQSYPEGFLTAKIANQIIGFLVGIITDFSVARILMLGVKNNFRHKGVASILLRRFIKNQMLSNVNRIDLEVRTNNHEAIMLYRKFGFSINEILPGFYQDGSDAYMMRLWLKPY